MAKASAITTPTREQVELVLRTAESAPLQNLAHAVAVDQALQAVAAFFRTVGVLPQPPAPKV